MNTPLDMLIANEQAKIELLRDKIKMCEQRVAMLRSMQSGDDDLDAALAKKVGGSAHPERPSSDPESQVAQQAPTAVAGPDVSSMSGAFPKKTLNKNTLRMLRFSGTTDKSIDQFVDFASSNGIDKDRQGIRAFLHQYKTAYKLLTSDRDGYFRLSDLGIAYLASIDAPAGGATSAT